MNDEFKSKNKIKKVDKFSPIKIHNDTHIKINELVKEYKYINKSALVSLLLDIAMDDPDLINKLKNYLIKDE